jgi:hypothetical protein
MRFKRVPRGQCHPAAQVVAHHFEIEARTPVTPSMLTKSNRRRARSQCLALLLTLLLASCYADLDWREVAPNDGGFSVLMPARAHEQSGPLAGISGGPTMHLWSAKASETVFGAGYIDIRNPDHALLAQLRDALVRNIDGRILTERSISGASLQGMDIVADGMIGDAKASLRARFVISGDRVYQIAMIGPPGAIPPAGQDMYFDSFRLRQAQP